jgi:hypothetical protein
MKCQLNFIICSLGLAILISLFQPAFVLAQDKPSAVQLHGSNVLEGQYSSRNDTNSQAPKDFLRNDFQMTLTVNNIPIATGFFLTTEQSDNLQRINNLRFSVDLITLKKNKARIEASNKANNLKNIKAPWMIRFLSNFSKIEAGKFRPDYGELTLQGISVSGANIEFTHKIVYAAIATGHLKRATSDESNLNETYKQKLFFGKFGFGEKATTHFYATYMMIQDETSVPFHGPEDTSITLKPESNAVFGAEFRLSFLKNKWTIDGNAGVSALTRDTRIENSNTNAYVDSIFQKIPEFLLNQVDPNVSTSGDYAYGLNSKLNLKTTTISGGYKYVGSGYYTLGNPILVNDRKSYEGRVDQALMKRRIALSAYFKRYQDNLIDWQPGTTTGTAYGIIARVTFNKVPYFQLGYTPNYQETKGDSLSLRNLMKIITFSTGYKYPIGSLMSFTSLSYFNQTADYENDNVIQYSNNTQTFSLNQILDFTKPFQLNFNASYSNMKSSVIDDRNVISLVLSGNHTYKKIWKNTIGWKYLNSSGVFNENKFNIFWDSQINFWKDWDFGLTIRENIFKNSTGADDYNEFIAQFKLTLKW